MHWYALINARLFSGPQVCDTAEVVMVVQVSTDLVSINEELRGYEAAWDAHVDAWLVVKVGTPEWVHRWRLQAEHAMRDSGKPGMTDEQVNTHTLLRTPMLPSIGVVASMSLEWRLTQSGDSGEPVALLRICHDSTVPACPWPSTTYVSVGGQFCGLLHASLQGLLARIVHQGTDDCPSWPAADARD